jgi:hypothetical protein
MKLIGLPVFGFWFSFVGRVRIYLNRDGSIVDTGAADMRDERGPWSVEWLGFGMTMTPAIPRDALTGKLVRLT